MPNVVLSSRANNTDSAYLTRWIVDAIRPFYEKNKQTKLWLEKKELVPAFPALDPLAYPFHIALNAAQYHFVRIVKFHRVNDFAVYATLGDSTELVLCCFSPNCVMDYETRNRERITLNTLNTLFVVGQVTLQFWNFRECKKWFNMDFPQSLRMVPVFWIEQAQIFDRDQIVSSRQFQWGYHGLLS